MIFLEERFTRFLPVLQAAQDAGDEAAAQAQHEELERAWAQLRKAAAAFVSTACSHVRLRRRS
jgi:hypothetical protein